VGPGGGSRSVLLRTDVIEIFINSGSGVGLPRPFREMRCSFNYSPVMGCLVEKISVGKDVLGGSGRTKKPGALFAD
jgi:hypothetical protein